MGKDTQPLPRILQKEVSTAARQLNIIEGTGPFKLLYRKAFEIQGAATEADFDSPAAIQEFRERLLRSASDIDVPKRPSDEEIRQELADGQY